MRSGDTRSRGETGHSEKRHRMETLQGDARMENALATFVTRFVAGAGEG